jgi:nucleolar protein 14
MDAEPTTEESATALGPDNPKPPPPAGDDYDHLVRELVFDKRSQPKDRTKTEEEIAQDEKEALEKAERARLRRMMGEEDEETDEEGGRRKRPRGGDDLDDDFIGDDKDEGWAGIGTGLQVSGAPQASDDEDGTEHTDPEQDEEDQESGSGAEDEDGNQSNYEDESDGSEEQVQTPLESTRKPEGRSKSLTSLPKNPKELPFTFPCPSSHDEFLEISEGVDRTDIGTVIDRIRKLHHPSFGEKNKSMLQVYLASSRSQTKAHSACRISLQSFWITYFTSQASSHPPLW